jgi:hypothetical protein
MLNEYNHVNNKHHHYYQNRNDSTPEPNENSKTKTKTRSSSRNERNNRRNNNDSSIVPIWQQSKKNDKNFYEKYSIENDKRKREGNESKLKT